MYKISTILYASVCSCSCQHSRCFGPSALSLIANIFVPGQEHNCRFSVGVLIFDGVLPLPPEQSVGLPSDLLRQVLSGSEEVCVCVCMCASALPIWGPLKSTKTHPFASHFHNSHFNRGTLIISSLCWNVIEWDCDKLEGSVVIVDECAGSLEVTGGELQCLLQDLMSRFH